MLCERCHEREAKILYTEIIGGIKKEQHLCEECAAQFTSFKIKKPEYNKELTLGDLLSTIFDTYYIGAKQGSTPKEELVCSRCHTSYKEFLETGRVGCSDCYHNFSNLLDKTLMSLQGTDHHIGKKPLGYAKEDSATAALRPIDKLTLALHTAIENEEYEEAARLRDQIRTLKEGTEHANGI